MAQPKPHFKNLQNDRKCASAVDTCGYSANHSASLHTTSTDQEILENVGLAAPAKEFHDSQSGKILHLFPQLAPSTIPQYIRDIETLKLSKLKQAYPKEHNSWRSRMSYANKISTPFHLPWEDFPAFLRDLGPIPVEGHTLDRIKHDEGYVPGNVRWASKTTQTHNRRTTILLTYNGKTLPLGVWAKETGQLESTLRGRRKRGWPHENIITGVPSKKTTASPSGRPWPPEYAQVWEQAYQKETGGNSDPVWYMAHVVSKMLLRLNAETEYFYFPPEYIPTPEEANALEKHTKEYERWDGFWRHLQQLRISMGKKPFDSYAIETFLRNWH